MYSEDFWEASWAQENIDDLHRFLDGYDGLRNEEIEVFLSSGISSVCDAACGYSVVYRALHANGEQTVIIRR